MQAAQTGWPRRAADRSATGPLADQLAEDKFLEEWDAENRDAIERALERMLAIYIANALPDPTDR
jgi:hypothetical protein